MSEKDLIRQALSLQYRVYKEQFDALHSQLSTSSSAYKDIDCLAEKEVTKSKIIAEVTARNHRNYSERQKHYEKNGLESDGKEESKSCRRLPQVYLHRVSR